ncbi:MAG TPA: hypothetical protein PKW98_14290, partial [Candidatus Wallbacteria bacterium]|nr:hypothetical protein [Candidatus Wallbacteria bacterium]
MAFWIPALMIVGAISTVIAASESGRSSGCGSRTRVSSDESGSRAEAVEREKNERRRIFRAGVEEYFNGNLARIFEEYDLLNAPAGKAIPNYSIEDIKDIILIKSQDFESAISSCFAGNCEDILNVAEELEKQISGAASTAAELSRRALSVESPEGLIKQAAGYIESSAGRSRARALIGAAISAFRAIGSASPYIVNTGLLKAGKSSL